MMTQAVGKRNQTAEKANARETATVTAFHEGPLTSFSDICFLLCAVSLSEPRHIMPLSPLLHTTT